MLFSFLFANWKYNDFEPRDTEKNKLQITNILSTKWNRYVVFSRKNQISSADLRRNEFRIHLSIRYIVPVICVKPFERAKSSVEIK